MSLSPRHILIPWAKEHRHRQTILDILGQDSANFEEEESFKPWHSLSPINLDKLPSGKLT